MSAMIIGAGQRCNLRFALALGVTPATIRVVTFSRRHMIASGACVFAPRLQASTAPLIFAAASLKSVLDEIAADIPMRLNYSGSGVLARQITLGAPADMFISANPKWMQVVMDAGRLSGGRIPLVGNRLVLVGATGAAIDPTDLPGRGRIAMGFTEAVPAGQYGKAALLSLGVWGKVQGQVVQTENVRAALALVSRGEVPWGIVYETDAMADPNVQIAARFPSTSHPPIVYEAGMIRGGVAGQTIDALKAHDAFTRHGFLPL